MSTYLTALAWHHLVWLGAALLIVRRESDPQRAHRWLCFGILGSWISPALALCVHALGGGLLPAPGIERLTDHESIGTRTWLLAAWGLLSSGAAAGFLRRLIRTRRLLRLTVPAVSPRLSSALREAQRRTDAGPVITRLAEQLDTPAIWCWSRVPTILMPTRLVSTLDEEALTALLCHELAHLRRRDHWAHLFLTVSAILLPWSPLVHRVRSRALALAESACDQAVLSAGVSPPRYARTLLGLATRDSGALTLAATGSSLTRRVESILAGPMSSPATRSGRVGVALGVALAALLSLLQTRAGVEVVFRGTDGSVQRFVHRDVPLTWSADHAAPRSLSEGSAPSGFHFVFENGDEVIR
ncbi:MAG: M56 family metallopeptidase [Planctomycetota bacterium]